MEDFVAKCLEDEYVKVEMKELNKHEINVKGVCNIEEFLRKRLAAERWREVEVNIAITGVAGAGKSSFINAIRGLYEDDDGGAPVGVTECTREPTAYDHPTNSNIKFWDFPGYGTPDYPDMETYVQKVQLEKYHAFLIFTASRFTRNDLLLAEKIRSMKKSFFFIRTKIDEDVRGESRKRSFNEEAMLMKIRRNCAKNLGDLLSNEEDIFLISNHEVDKWDFVRLTQAILDGLTRYQRESLTLSLGKVVTRSSAEIFQRKVNVLKGRIWKVAAVSAAAAIFPFPQVSATIDNALISCELRLYRSQLGLPEEGSAEFAKLSLATKEKVKKVALTTAAQLIEFMEPYIAKAFGKEIACYLPVVGMAVKSGISYGATYYALYNLLGAVEDAALSVLREAHEKTFAELEVEWNY